MMLKEEKNAIIEANKMSENFMAGIQTLFLFIIKQTKHGGANP